MSFHGFFQDGATNPADEQSSTEPGVYQRLTPTPRPTRVQPQVTIGNVLANAPYYPSRSTWTPVNVNTQSDLSFLQGNSGSQYYTLSSALNHGNATSSYHEPSEHAYIPSPTQPAKIENPTLCQQLSSSQQYQHSSFAQYHASYTHHHAAALGGDIPYHSVSAPYHPESDLIALDSHDISRRRSTDVKEEPRTPASPQFIFEFPGAEDDPPPFELPSASNFCDLSSSNHDQGSPGFDAVSSTRPSSPTTDAMKSMMSVFRVDPFASYDVDSGTRRKRRKRASTYARTTDPEASSKEPPLIFTFQLDVAPPSDWGFEHEDDGDMGGGIDELDSLYALPSSDSDPMHHDYEAFSTDMGPYKLPPVSAPVFLEGNAGGEGLFAQTHPDAVDYTLSRPFHPIDASGSHGSTSSLDAGLTYPMSDSRHSSPTLSLPRSHSEALELLDDTEDATLTAVEDTHIAFTVLESKRERERPRTSTKMHVCWICHKEFPRPSGLATHMNTHSGAKPYKCPVPTCAKPFAVRSNARRHLRTHTDNMEWIPPPSHDEYPRLDLPGPESENEELDYPVLESTSESPAADSPSSTASPSSSPPYFPRSLATRNNASRLTSQPPFDDADAPFSSGVSVPLAPAIPSTEEDGKYEERNSFVDHGLPFPYHPTQFKGLPGPRAVYGVSLNGNPLVALEAC